MLRWFIALGAAALLALPAVASAGRPAATGALLAQMNHVRAEHGLGRLQVDARLERAAVAHTRAMLASGVFDHGAFGSRMVRFDVMGRLAGENLAWGTGARGTAGGIVAAWLASPEHRANLLRPSFTRVGIGERVGAFHGAGGARVVTVDFAG